MYYKYSNVVDANGIHGFFVAFIETNTRCSSGKIALKPLQGVLAGKSRAFTGKSSFSTAKLTQNYLQSC